LGSAFAVLAALVVGIALGLALGGGSSPVEDRVAPSPPPEVEEEVSSLLPDAPATPVRRSEPRRAPSEPDFVLPPAEGVELPAPGEASGTIQGKVRSEGGTPLAGVLVRAVGSRPRPPGEGRARRDPLEEPDVSEQVRELLTAHRWREATRREARTDASGRYALGDLSDTSYSLVAGLEGYELEPVGRSTGVEPGQRVDFVAWKVVPVPLLVLLPDGATAGGATVEFETEGRGSTPSYWTPQHPAVPVRPGPNRVTASLQGPPEMRSPKETVVVEDGIEPPLVTLRLEGRTGIRGRVVFPEEEEPERAVVYLLRLLAAASGDADSLRRDGAKIWVRRGWNFAFEQKDIPAGTYLLAAAWDDSLPIAVTETVEVEAAIVERMLEFPPLDPNDFVLLRVLDPKGRLLRDVQIRTGFRGPKGSSSGNATTIAKEDGTFLVMHHPPREEGVVEGVQWIQARSPLYGEEVAEYVRGRVGEVTIAFEEPALLHASVAGYAGSGHEGSLRLQLRKRSSGGPGGWSPFYEGDRRGLDEDGRQTFGPMQPGPYELVLGIRDEGNRYRPIEVAPTNLAPGENRVTVSVPPLYRLTVLVEESRPGSQIQIEPRSYGRGGWNARERVGADGRATFQRLLAGDYRLSLLGSGKAARMSISLPGPEHVVFLPDR
jgi:hypothetical protein